MNASNNNNNNNNNADLILKNLNSRSHSNVLYKCAIQ